VPRTHNGERTVSSISGAGKTGYPHAEMKEVPTLHHTHKKKMDQRFKPKT